VRGATIRLGWVLVTTGPVELANIRTDEAGAVTAGLIPALGNNTAHLRWLGADSIGQEPLKNDNQNFYNAKFIRARNA
jgi:hypothetical protein